MVCETKLFLFFNHMIGTIYPNFIEYIFFVDQAHNFWLLIYIKIQVTHVV